MKHLVKRLTLGIIGAALVASTGAHAAQLTNSVQYINFRVVLLGQGTADVNSDNPNFITQEPKKTVLVTSNIINILGTLTGNTFPPTAKLVRVENPVGETASARFQVRNGTNVLADVTSYFNLNVKRVVLESQEHLLAHLTNGTDLAYVQLTFNQGGAPTFDVSGVVYTEWVTLYARKAHAYFAADEMDGDGMTGLGADFDGTPCIVSANIGAHGSFLELRPEP